MSDSVLKWIRCAIASAKRKPGKSSRRAGALRRRLATLACLAAGMWVWTSEAVTLRPPLLFDIFPGWQQGMPIVSQGLTLPVVNDRVIVPADDGAHGYEVWASDGTAPGTMLLKDIYPGKFTAGFGLLGTTARYVFFSANDGVHGRELWRTDGTPAGTIMLGDLEPGPADATFLNYTAARSLPDGRLLIPVGTSRFGTELWITDGTPGGTALVKDIALGGTNAIGQILTRAGGHIYFDAYDGSGKYNTLWMTDGTAAGTTKVLTDKGSPLSDIYYVHAFKGFAIVGVLGSSPQATWITDGTPAGTRVLAQSIMARAPIECGGYLYWGNLRRTDGTQAGTSAVRKLSYISDWSCLGGIVLFAGSDDTAGSELWRTDGTASGTYMVTDINPGSSGSSPSQFQQIGTRLFFVATTAANGRELWVTDGTSAGTAMVADIAPFAASSGIDWLVAAGGAAFFVADSPSGRTLWTSDGTAAGTRNVNELFPGAGITNPEQLTVATDGLFFTASGPNTRRELWFLPLQDQVVSVVEFYNQSLDHYFISASQADIEALDSHRFPGWARTGRSFSAIPDSAAAPAAATPVCRFYGDPNAGLDSHFYSASPVECQSVRARFPAWIFESANVFKVYLPNSTTGACAAGTVPVYRAFNNRADVNHRYTTDIALLQQMVARGYVAEGYGNPPVAMCAPR